MFCVSIGNVVAAECGRSDGSRSDPRHRYHRLAHNAPPSGGEHTDVGRGPLCRHDERREHACRLCRRRIRQAQLHAVLECGRKLLAPAFALPRAKRVELIGRGGDERVLLAAHGLGAQTRGRTKHRRQVQLGTPLRQRRQRTALDPRRAKIRRARGLDASDCLLPARCGSARQPQPGAAASTSFCPRTRSGGSQSTVSVPSPLGSDRCSGVGRNRRVERRGVQALRERLEVAGLAGSKAPGVVDRQFGGDVRRTPRRLMTGDERRIARRDRVPDRQCARRETPGPRRRCRRGRAAAAAATAGATTCDRDDWPMSRATCAGSRTPPARVPTPTIGQIGQLATGHRRWQTQNQRALSLLARRRALTSGVASTTMSTIHGRTRVPRGTIGL